MDEQVLVAAKNADWMQLVLHQGPPCFYLEGQRFCLRAEWWGGHHAHHASPPQHKFVSLHNLLAASSQAAQPLELPSLAECTCVNNPLNSWPNLPHDKDCPLFVAPAPAPAEKPAQEQLGICDEFKDMPHERKLSCVNWQPLAASPGQQADGVAIGNRDAELKAWLLAWTKGQGIAWYELFQAHGRTEVPALALRLIRDAAGAAPGSGTRT